MRGGGRASDEITQSLSTDAKSTVTHACCQPQPASASLEAQMQGCMRSAHSTCLPACHHHRTALHRTPPHSTALHRTPPQTATPIRPAPRQHLPLVSSPPPSSSRCPRRRSLSTSFRIVNQCPTNSASSNAAPPSQCRYASSQDVVIATDPTPSSTRSPRLPVRASLSPIKQRAWAMRATRATQRATLPYLQTSTSSAGIHATSKLLAATSISAPEIHSHLRA